MVVIWIIVNSRVQITLLEACPLTKTNFKSVDFVINKFFMKLFQTNNIDTVNQSINQSINRGFI